ncbi:MAG: sugar ABC transporter permease [Alloscardovia omnicolens]|uniref:carbohydrate ABC transporter permease n=1 Tax=Alloscardovia omnicolens TaxID=419015 RepID=UPI00242B4B4C|nr:sugar ABC transporter permease [Alloscardovia omnicolens]MBS6346379.1 sugar ABC transporter permease [Alloscardovia omnicolens]
MLGSTSKSHRPSAFRSFMQKLEWKASPYLYVAPFFILFAVIGLFPMFYTLVISTRAYNTLTGDGGLAVCGSTCGSTEASWYGNFMWVLHQRSFYHAVRNSFTIFLLSSVPQIIIALWLAWILDANLKAKTFCRVGVLLPYVVAPSAAGIIFSQLFSDKMGAINVVLQSIGLQPIAWHSSTFWSQLAIATIVNWRWIGYNTLILLAAMQAIPRDVLEAAVVDGASAWRTYRSVTLPMLRPTLLFVIITSTIGGLQIFDEPQLFHNGGGVGGGANDQYLTVSIFLYKLGFVQVTPGQPNLGRAAAVAWLLFLIIVTFALLNYFLTQNAGQGGKKSNRKALAAIEAQRHADFMKAKKTGVEARSAGENKARN